MKRGKDLKAAFIYGNADFYQDDNGKIYSGGTVTTDIWKRYLLHFDSLIAVGRRMIMAPKEKKLSNVTMENVEIKLIPPTNGLKNILWNSNNVRRICRDVLRNTDCAIIRLPSITGIIACQEAEKLGKPYMVEVVGCIKDTLWYHGSLRGKLAANPLYILNKNTIKNAPFAIYVTQDFLQNRYPCNRFSCGCSDVVIKSLDNTILRLRKEKINNMSAGKSIKIGIVGSLNVDYKGHKTAMFALSNIKDKLNFELHLLGSGNKNRWEQLAADLGIRERVVFDGTFPSGQPVLDWMDELDLYLIPSLTEGLPRALVEAMSRGLPAIGSDTGGIKELLNEENLHRPKDHKELANKILKLVSNKQKLTTCAERNFFHSKDYSEEELDSRRNEFFKRFKASIKKINEVNVNERN